MSPNRCRRHQGGAMLIEVLVAMLLLTIGMLSLGVKLSFSVQMPKLSGHRAVAVNLASSHISSIRANPRGVNHYVTPLRETQWSFEKIEKRECAYPDCDEISLAAMDDAATRRAVRIALPAGDLLVKCSTTPCLEDSHGDVWVVWQDPGTYENLHTSLWDNCPKEAINIYTDPKPRCIYVGFKL